MRLRVIWPGTERGVSSTSDPFRYLLFQESKSPPGPNAISHRAAGK